MVVFERNGAYNFNSFSLIIVISLLPVHLYSCRLAIFSSPPPSIFNSLNLPSCVYVCCRPLRDGKSSHSAKTTFDSEIVEKLMYSENCLFPLYAENLGTKFSFKIRSEIIHKSKAKESKSEECCKTGQDKIMFNKM